MTAARTPVHSYYVDADFNVCYGSQIMEPLEIVATIETLTAENAALREALKHALVYIEHPEVRRITNEFSLPSDGFILNCRAALALADGGEK